MEDKIFFAAPVDNDFDFFHKNLCQADKDELVSVANVNLETLGDEIKGYCQNSFISMVAVSHKTMLPVAIFGCVAREWEKGAIVGYPWMLTTGELPEYAKEVMQKARSWVHQFSQYFSYMHVVASDEHPFSIRFLKRLGFTEDVTVDLPNLKGKVLIYV